MKKITEITLQGLREGKFTPQIIMNYIEYLKMEILKAEYKPFEYKTYPYELSNTEIKVMHDLLENPREFIKNNVFCEND